MLLGMRRKRCVVDSSPRPWETVGINPARIRQLNGNQVQKGSFVLLWLQASVRSGCNHALEYAIGKANELRKPVVACFALMPHYPEANERHYAFLLEGLADAGKALRERGIPLLVRQGEPRGIIEDLAGDACLVVTDRGYLRHQRVWRAEAAGAVGCPVVQVESDVVVPVEAASGKEEYAAATLRPKIHRLLPDFLEPLGEQRVRHPLTDPGWETLRWEEPDRILASLNIDRSVPRVAGFRGGTAEARRRLAEFIRGGLGRFAAERNDPVKGATSGLSPYLHFGQISPLEIALAAGASGSPSTGAFLEELIVRRELSMDFVLFNPRYDSIDALPSWARKTLEEHSRDPREYMYTPKEFEQAETHDPAWNAAQAEMVRTGKMHGYMRMYWGKKILEWSETPAEAYRTALHLNNRYELDGRDPNGYAGVAWCFGKHDRPWGERKVFGKVRYMGAPGLARKFDVHRYIAAIQGEVP